MTVLSLVMILNNSDRKSHAKSLKLHKSVLDPLMEIVHLMQRFLVVFPTFNKCVTMRSQEDVLKTTKWGKLVLLTWTPTMFNFILVVILLIYRVINCVTSAIRTKYGEHYYDYNGKTCEMLEIAEECLASINGNCATDVFFSMAFSQLRQECDQEKRTP